MVISRRVLSLSLYNIQMLSRRVLSLSLYNIQMYVRLKQIRKYCIGSFMFAGKFLVCTKRWSRLVFDKARLHPFAIFRFLVRCSSFWRIRTSGLITKVLSTCFLTYTFGIGLLVHIHQKEKIAPEFAGSENRPFWLVFNVQWWRKFSMLSLFIYLDDFSTFLEN